MTRENDLRNIRRAKQIADKGRSIRPIFKDIDDAIIDTEISADTRKLGFDREIFDFENSVREAKNTRI